MFGDHVQFGHGKAVSGSGGTCVTCCVSDEGYVMAQMWLEIHTAGADLENVARVVFYNGVIAIRAAQATLNAGLVCIGAWRWTLCKRQSGQQGRYNDQQECSLHGILRRTSTCSGVKFRLGFKFCFRF
jgi:hypothetical protein